MWLLVGIHFVCSDRHETFVPLGEWADSTRLNIWLA